MQDHLTILLPGNVPLDLIFVQRGFFIMGSEGAEAFEREGPEHIVEITQPFYLGKYPVTQAQWQAVMGNNPASFTGAQRPVEQVSWRDIVEGRDDDAGASTFLTVINAHLAATDPALAKTHRFRLPTEAEWEYAAKGGPRYARANLAGKKASELYATYAGGDRLESCGWFGENSGVETRPVGLKGPNELGLYDMSGNVFEWCQDNFSYNYDKNPYAARKDVVARDPAGLDSGGYRVLRGGGCWYDARLCRSAYRFGNHPSNRNDSIGFRLVLSPSSAGWVSSG